MTRNRGHHSHATTVELNELSPLGDVAPRSVQLEENQSACGPPQIQDSRDGFLPSVAALVRVHCGSQPVQFRGHGAPVGFVSQTRPPRRDAHRFPRVYSRCAALGLVIAPGLPELARSFLGNQVDMEGHILSRVRATEVLCSPVDHAWPWVIPGHLDLFIVGNTTVSNASKDPPTLGERDFNAERETHGVQPIRKALAEFLFGDEDALIQLDMSEFSEKHTSSRLFGAPPGYVGYDEGGELTEKVRRRPFSVVLFDEVEKAHPDIFNSLLQILEEGRLTDSQGRKVDFKNTVIIMTTNLGTRDINKGVLTGFQSTENITHDYSRMKAKVNEELKQHFRPEFLNRVDEVVVFPPLDKEQIKQIVDLMIANLAKRMEAQDMKLQITDEARELLADRGFDPVLGARPLRRAIQRDIEDALSERILFGDILPGQVVTVGVKGEGEEREFTFNGQ